MTPAYGYLRVSGKGQIDGDGFTRQREAIRRYAAAHGIRIVKWFEERGVSGTLDHSDRPAFTEMLEAMLSDGVQTIVAETLNRIARELMVQESIVGYLRSKGLTLITTDADDVTADTDDPMREAMRQIQGVFAQLEKRMTVKKLKAARARARAKTGRCEGRKPYGDHPGEAEALARMVEMRNSGSTFEQIAAALATAGIKPRQGESWHPYAISRIVKRTTKR